MLILGIHDGHNCGATLLSGGQIVASVSEERLSRVKNDLGYPRLSIDEVMRIGSVGPADLDRIVYASNFMHTKEHLATAAEWYRAGLEDQHREANKTAAYKKAIFDVRRAERIKQVIEHLEGEADRISFLDHHLAHAAAAYFGSPFSFEQPTLVLTCDGAGDGLSSTVSIGKGCALERIAFTKLDASIGKVYSRVTYSLGLTPWEHEYKVMGLAPYADPKRAASLVNVFRGLVVLAEDGLTFKCANEIQTSFSYFYLRDKLERSRFDEIAGGVQLYTEEMLSNWVRNCIARTGIRRLACGGGVFMNVKANLRISQLDEVDEMFVFPSCGDESLSLGAVWHEYYRSLSDDGRAKLPAKEYLKDIYLGDSYPDAQVKSAIDSELDGTDCGVERYEDIDEEVARRLSENRIVARFAGRMEWGARALGNRSILANPREWRNVEKINNMIKMRDFWMPFAPSMMKEKQGLYLKNGKAVDSPFMMFAFDTTHLAEEHLGAAIHPRDKTARAQLVTREQNPRYWSLLHSFEAKTGVSAVLNTSFNLHGHPLVYSPRDAIKVFLNSGLDCLALENLLISKGAPR
jgi:carbamoyltransferase